MPKLNRELGSYAQQQMLQPLGFQLNGAGAPTVLRDGTNISTASGKLFTVSRVSAGLYTVTLSPLTRAWPVLPFVVPHIEQAAAPTAVCQVKYVKGSYSASAKTFQVQIQTVGTTPAASDGDAGDRVTILMMGGLGTSGIDPA